MLKHLYKTFLISLITWSLLGFNSAVVLAQTEAKATVTTDKNGVITAKKTHKFEKVSDEDMLSSIAMLAAGVVTGRMLKNYRPVTTDVTIAAAGGVAFIAGEVISNVKFKGKIDAMTIEVEKKSDGTVNEEQIQRLKDLKKSYEEARSTTKTKKMLQLASAAAFTAAGAMAAFKGIEETKLFATCNQSLVTAQSDLAVCPEATPERSFYRAYCEQGATLIKDHQANLSKLEASRLPLGPSKGILVTVTSSQKDVLLYVCNNMVPGSVTPPKACGNVVASCQGYLESLKHNQSSSMNPLDLGKSNNDFLEQLFNKGIPTKITDSGIEKGLYSIGLFSSFMNIFFPEAKASWLPMFGLTAGTLASFFLITGETAIQVDNFMFAPRNRAIAFGGLALVALNASRSSDKTMGKLDDNIKKIDVILADMNQLAKGVKTQNISQQNAAISTVNPGITLGGTYSADGTVKSQCMANNSTENCTALSDQLKSMPGYANLPDSFKDIANQSVSMADGLSGTTGISGSTLSTAESLGTKYNALAKVLKGQQETLNKISGKKTNFEKEQDKFLNGVKARVKKGLMKSGMTATGFMASLGTSPIDSSASKDDKKLTKGTPLTGGIINTAATGDAEAEKEKEALKLEFKDETPVVEGDTLYAAGGSGKPDYDIKTNEISGEHGPSLFEVISRRYIKSGYPKLLEEEPTESMNN